MPGVSEFTLENRRYASNTKKLLASGFLDTLGESRFDTSKPVEFNALEEVLINYGSLFIKGFSEELNKADANASGALDSSMRFEFSKTGRTYEVIIYMASYAKFVDEGVQGIGSDNKNITSPYKFKFPTPSVNHVAALEKWIKEKNVTAVITVPKGIVSKILTPKSLAYAIGYATKQRGLKATYFKKKTVESMIDNFKRDVALAIGEDIKVNILF